MFEPHYSKRFRVTATRGKEWPSFSLTAMHARS